MIDINNRVVKFHMYDFNISKPNSVKKSIHYEIYNISFTTTVQYNAPFQ